MVTAWDHGQLVEIDRHRKRQAADTKHGNAEAEVGVDITEAVGLNGYRRFIASALFRLSCPASLDNELLRTASIHSLQRHQCDIHTIITMAVDQDASFAASSLYARARLHTPSDYTRLPTQWLDSYASFVRANASQVSQLESGLRSVTYIIPGTISLHIQAPRSPK